MKEKEKDNLDWNKEVQDLISRITELREINSRYTKIEKEYENKNKDDKYFNAFEEKNAFEDILFNFVYFRQELKDKLDERPFFGISIKDDILNYAKKYIDSKYLHNSFLTNVILAQIIDTELVPLEYEVRGITHPAISNFKISNLFPYPWNKLASIGLSLLFLIIGGLMIFFLLAFKITWLAWVIGIIIVWNYVSKIFLFINNIKLKGKLTILSAKYRLIRDEIGNHTYDGKVLKERINKLENDGLYVPSLIYSFLDLTNSVNKDF